MENILLAIDAEELEMNAVDFACYMARLTRSSLTGVFLENSFVEDVPVVKIAYGMPYVETIVANDLPGIVEKKNTIHANIALFGEACSKRGVNCFVRHVKASPLKEMLAESRFADLIIVSAETSFGKKHEGVPTHFVKELLAGSECPVVVAPHYLDRVDELLFTCDGSRSAAYAIRQFTHLFPELYRKPVTILRVNEKDAESCEDNARLEEWVNRHYYNTKFVHLEGKASDALFGCLLEKKNMFVVLGAYGRSSLSHLFHKSTADVLVKTVNLPLFIAHC
jgi:hypothetical protein